MLLADLLATGSQAIAGGQHGGTERRANVHDQRTRINGFASQVTRCHHRQLPTDFRRAMNEAVDRMIWHDLEPGPATMVKLEGFQIAASPVSPVRIRMVFSKSETKILPSPI